MVALIAASGTVVAAVLTAVLTRRAQTLSPPPNGTKANPKEDHPVDPAPPIQPAPATPPATLGELLLLMHERNVKCLKSTAEALIGPFEFCDITNTGLPPEYQALICKGDGTHTGRWNDHPTVIAHVGQATLACNLVELQQQLGLNG
jgi:hypothetical protein